MDGFVAHVATFRPIEILDIRPCRSFHPNAIFQVADLSDLATGPRSCCDSASCLHALEHFGLGRYGDPVGADHWKSGLTALSLMLESGGWLYLSVPIGRQRVEFNAHRVFHVSTIQKQASSYSLYLMHFPLWTILVIFVLNSSPPRLMTQFQETLYLVAGFSNFRSLDSHNLLNFYGRMLLPSPNSCP